MNTMFRQIFIDEDDLPFWQYPPTGGRSAKARIIKLDKYDQCYFISTILFFYFTQFTDPVPVRYFH